MQYGVEIFPYQRSKKVNKEVTGKNNFKLMLFLKPMFYFLSAFLISRVILINLMAPFGIAFLISMLLQKDNKYILPACIGTFLGYVSIYNNIKNLGAYLIIVGTLFLVNNLINNMKKTYKILLFLSIIFVVFSLYKLFMVNLSTPVSVITSFFETVCVFPIYYITSYSIKCFKQINTSHLYNSEEIISMCVTISLVVAGTWGSTIFELSLRNIIALTCILIIGYIKGSASGAACGVAMGVITGISCNNMIEFIGVYGVCGLIAGIFNEVGKWMSMTAYLIAFSILKMYSNIGHDFQFIEAAIACVTFIVIPRKIYKKISVDLDWYKKEEKLKQNYADKIKDMFVDKLINFSQMLFNISDTLENLADNDKLALKGKSSALVENLADRVCSNCNMNSICWKRETFYTYNAFSELIQNYQSKRNVIPYEIDRKCIKRSALVKHTESIVSNYIINEIWRNQLSEGREILAGQINNMGGSMEEIISDFKVSVKFNTTMESSVRRILTKNAIKYKDIYCFNDKNNRLLVNISLNVCGGEKLCVKSILPLINKVTKNEMCLRDDACNINMEDKSCNVVLEEAPKYHIASAAGRVCKDGEQSNGDSYSFQKLNDGTYMTIISDGMGSGSRAEEESGAVVELMEKFIKAGFSKSTAINSINSIMTIKFSQDEKFSTVDLNSINLYTGEVEFMKVGAVASFIKKGKEVEVIKSKTLPIGVLDKVDIDITEKKIDNGDIIVMVSDGVLDYNAENAGKCDWIIDYLKEIEYNEPEEISNSIIDKATELSAGKINDDMTVVVSKVYSLR